MRNTVRISVLVLAVSATGCAALAPDRAVQSTMTLAPGQVAVGRFQIPDGSRGLVAFQRQPPRKGVEPLPESWNYSGDPKVQIAFPDNPLMDQEGPLGYAQQWIDDGSVCRVILRNHDTAPQSFQWIVSGGSGVLADWDLRSPAESE
jgi:hypothetical protein